MKTSGQKENVAESKGRRGSLSLMAPHIPCLVLCEAMLVAVFRFPNTSRYSSNNFLPFFKKAEVGTFKVTCSQKGFTTTVPSMWMLSKCSVTKEAWRKQVADSPSSGFFTNLTPSSSNLLQAPCTSGTAIPMWP